MDAFQMNYAFPVGVFATFTNYDENALFLPIDFAKKILDYDTELSYIAVFPDNDVAPEKVQKKIEKLVGNDFIIINQMQQEALLYQTIQAENLIVFFILGFIFVLAAFNIISILGMLVVEKKQDISILYTLGASKTLLKKVFLMIGIIIGIFGGFLGMCIGLICCFIQKYFGIISFGDAGSSFLISAYPVSIYLKDFIVVFSFIVLISLLTSIFSLRGLKHNYLTNKY